MMLPALLLLAQTGAAAYDPQGVHVDAEGVLRSRTVDPDPRLAEIRRKARGKRGADGLLYVSLPRLFAEARRLAEAGKPLPDEVRYVGGMTKLRYVFVYPDEDLVIAGPAEEFDASVPWRPLGRVSGRAVLHLDDVVTAIRAFGPGKRPDRLGCDIEITREIQERIAAKTKAVGPAAQTLGFAKTCAKIADAGGPQPVTYYGVDPATRFAVVCVEADYRLKQLALGILPSPVKAVKSYRDLVLVPERQYRFSLESRYDALLASPDGLAFELRGPSLMVNGGLLGRPDTSLDDVSPAARKFVTLCNDNFAKLLRSLSSWDDLCNLGDLSVLGALLARDRLAEKAGWDPAWVLEEYPTAKIRAPASAATLVNVKVSGRNALFLSGGVWINPAEWASKRSADASVAGKAARPEEGWRSRR